MANSNVYFVFFVEVNYHVRLFDKIPKNNHTHEWSLKLKPLNKFNLKGVEFKLHESFQRPRILFQRPPYEIKETGYGTFDMKIIMNLFGNIFEEIYPIVLYNNPRETKLVNYFVLSHCAKPCDFLMCLQNGGMPTPSDKFNLTKIQEKLNGIGPDYYPQDKYRDLFNFVKSKVDSIAPRLPVVNSVDTNQTKKRTNNLPKVKTESNVKAAPKKQLKLKSPKKSSESNDNSLYNSPIKVRGKPYQNYSGIHGISSNIKEKALAKHDRASIVKMLNNDNSDGDFEINIPATNPSRKSELDRIITTKVPADNRKKRQLDEEAEDILSKRQRLNDQSERNVSKSIYNENRTKIALDDDFMNTMIPQKKISSGDTSRKTIIPKTLINSSTKSNKNVEPSLIKSKEQIKNKHEFLNDLNDKTFTKEHNGAFKRQCMEDTNGFQNTHQEPPTKKIINIFEKAPNNNKDSLPEKPKTLMIKSNKAFDNVYSSLRNTPTSENSVNGVHKINEQKILENEVKKCEQSQKYSTESKFLNTFSTPTNNDERIVSDSVGKWKGYGLVNSSSEDNQNSDESFNKYARKSSFSEINTETRTKPVTLTIPHKSNQFKNVPIHESFFDNLDEISFEKNDVTTPLSYMKIPKKTQNIEKATEKQASDSRNKREDSNRKLNDHRRSREDNQSKRRHSRSKSSSKRRRSRSHTSKEKRKRARDQHKRHDDSKDPKNYRHNIIKKIDNPNGPVQSYREHRMKKDMNSNTSSYKKISDNKGESKPQKQTDKKIEKNQQNTKDVFDNHNNHQAKSHTLKKMRQSPNENFLSKPSSTEIMKVGEKEDKDMDLSSDEHIICEESVKKSQKIVSKPNSRIKQKSDFVSNSDTEDSSGDLAIPNPIFTIENSKDLNKINQGVKPSDMQYVPKESFLNKNKSNKMKKTSNLESNIPVIHKEKVHKTKKPTDILASPIYAPFKRQFFDENIVADDKNYNQTDERGLEEISLKSLENLENIKELVTPFSCIERIRMKEELTKIDDRIFYEKLHHIICTAFCRLDVGLTYNGDSIKFDLSLISDSLAYEMRDLIDNFYLRQLQA